MPHPLLTGLSELSAPDLRARLVEARKTATALVTTDLTPARHTALVEGVAAVDAALRQASLDAVIALVRHIEAATPPAPHPALKARPHDQAPPLIDPRAMITPRPPIPPRVPVPAPAPAAPRAPGGLGALRRAVPAAPQPQPEETPEPARPRPREIGTEAEFRRWAGRGARPSVRRDGTTDWRFVAHDPADDDIPW